MILMFPNNSYTSASFFRLSNGIMAQLLKCSAGLVRIPLAASWKPCTKVIMRTEHSANSFLPKSHSLACISTSTKFYKNPSRYKDSKKAIQEDSKGHEIKTVKEKHIQILIAITDHDLEIKLKKICSWLVKGYSVKIKILTSFKNPDKSEKVREGRVCMFQSCFS